MATTTVNITRALDGTYYGEARRDGHTVALGFLRRAELFDGAAVEAHVTRVIAAREAAAAAYVEPVIVDAVAAWDALLGAGL